jgi:RNA polymerase sigma-70 factor (ECF subfamily)
MSFAPTRGANLRSKPVERRIVSETYQARTQRTLNETRELLDGVLLAYHPQLFRHAFRILGTREDAEDALQDAFLSAACHFDQFEGRSKLSTWLTRVVINAALMVRRGKHGYRETSLENLLSHREDQAPLEIADDRQRDPEQIYASSEIGALIAEQFNQLSPTLRSAFQLHHIDGLSCEEAGQSLGITVSAVKSRVGRAKRQMASRLNQVRPEPGQSKLNKRREA